MNFETEKDEDQNKPEVCEETVKLVQKIIEEEGMDKIVRLAILKCSVLFPFYTKAFTSLTFVRDRSGRTQTAAIDKNFRMYYNSEFIANTMYEALLKRNDPCKFCEKKNHNYLDMIAGIIFHEISHPLRNHFGRAEQIPDVDHFLWNIAGDLEINDDLIEMVKYYKNQNTGFCVINNLFLPNTFKKPFPEGKTAETYYYLLQEGIEKNEIKVVDLNAMMGDSGSDGEKTCGSGATGKSDKNDLPDPDKAEGSPGLTESEVTFLYKRVAQDVREHQKNGQNPGLIPESIQRWADEILHQPKYDWRSELKSLLRYSVERVRGDQHNTYQRLGRRTASLGNKVILPSKYTTLPNITLVIDTSGSMSEEHIKTAVSEAKGVLDAARASVTILDCDTEVKSKQKIGDIRKLTLGGGGGTDMGVGINLALSQKEVPNLIVVLTDGYTPWPTNPPTTRTRIVAGIIGGSLDECNNVSKHVPDFIKCVNINMED